MNFAELVPRVLTKLGIIGAGQQPADEDRLVVLDKLRAVHASLKVDDVLQWTSQDIPDFAEEPYVVMAAHLAAPDFGRPTDPAWWPWGRGQISMGTQIRQRGPVQADYF